MADAVRLPTLPAEPAPGDLLTHHGRTWTVLAVDSYPDGLRLTLEDQEHTHG